MMLFLQASKAAQIAFYETLRAEFGPDIKITIATPGGWVESEMVKGKHISKDGVMHVNEDMRDVSNKFIGIFLRINNISCSIYFCIPLLQLGSFALLVSILLHLKFYLVF